MLLIAVLIRLADGPPVLFRQERVGQGGKPFTMIKFRTMRAEPEGSSLTVGNDPRVTGLGRYLRRAKLDELPQLLNVIRGDMSLVGPRPEVPEFVRHYSPEQRRILQLRPGITDPASRTYWNEPEILARSPSPQRTYLDEILPEKIRLSQEYAARATLLSDLVEIVRIAGRVLRGGSA